ncbi:extracellular solute-binding protein [Arenibaculum pallidiluteum]|uniref:extracellular solute-binding protein n=1 Tax=Arenibaculum pallidiluteum TaxID=2812559 RepID=UPI001F428623|nr:extracellular solute-binding protein [Arenibaculum pallidiluteum]
MRRRSFLAAMIATLVPAAAPRARAPGADDPPPRHGLAMHGEPAYGPGFAHFRYVDPEAPQGGTLRMAVTAGFDSLHPHIPRGRPAPGLSLTYETLLGRSLDEPFSLYGLLAETLRTPEDRSWVEFTLRPGARWHDGLPVTVEDVLFSWRVLRDHGRPGPRLSYARVRDAGPSGPRSLRFGFGQGEDRELPLIMGLMPILPRHHWEGRRFDETTLDPPLGSGPYRVEAAEPGRSVTYARVPGWWGRGLAIGRGQHNFDRVRYDVYRDEHVALEAFLAGQVDFRRETDPVRWAGAYEGPALRAGRIRREALPHGRTEPLRGFVFNTRRPLFGDIRLREALGFAFDFEWINRTLFRGAYRRTASLFPNSELAAAAAPDAAELRLLDPWRAVLPPDLFERPFAPPRTDGSGPAGHRANLREADRLLRAAGWEVRDGRRLDPAGTPLSFEILLADPADEKVALEFARGLDRLGVAARVRTVDSAQYQARAAAFDFDMTIGRWGSTLSPGNEQLSYWSAAAADAPGGRNLAGIRSPAVDALAAGLATARTRAELVAGARALDRAVMWGHYLIPLYHLPEDRVAYRDSLRRPRTVPLYGFAVETWWSRP